MTALSADRKTQYKEGIELNWHVGANKKIYAGSLVSFDQTTGHLEPASDAASKTFAGVALQASDNTGGGAAAIDCLVRRRGVFLFDIAAAGDDDIGKAVFVVDDQTVGLVADVSNPIFVGIIYDVESATKVWVDIYPALLQTDVATHLADASSAHAASAISIADSDSLITGTDAEAALAEIMTGIKTAQYTLFPQAITLEDGTAIGKFSSEDQPSVGWAQLSNKELALRWNNHATPGKVALQFAMPQDLNDAAALVLHLLGAIVKAGASEADSPVFTVEAYFSEAGAAPAADTNCGGESGEFLTEATNNWQEKTLSIAHGDVPASPSVLTLIINPKDGQLPADDFVLAIPWLEASRKCLTA